MRPLGRLRRPDLAIDLGSDRTRLVGRGVPLTETPTRDPASGVRIVAKGVVVDGDAAARLAGPLLARARRLPWTRPRVVASCPLHVDPARSRLVRALERAGAGEVEVLRSTVAAAAGADLDVTAPHAAMLVDVGAALTEIAVFRDGSLVAGDTIGLGLRDLRLPGARHGSPRLLVDPRAVARHVLQFWRRLALDVQVEVVEGGLVLTGGGAGVPPVVEAMAAVTRLEVRVPADPAQAVIRGLARLSFDRPPS